jgi:hypothetical protein
MLLCNGLGKFRYKQVLLHKELKVKFTLEQIIKARGEYRYDSTLSLTSALDKGGWSTPRQAALPPGMI